MQGFVWEKGVKRFSCPSLAEFCPTLELASHWQVYLISTSKLGRCFSIMGRAWVSSTLCHGIQTTKSNRVIVNVRCQSGQLLWLVRNVTMFIADNLAAIKYGFSTNQGYHIIHSKINNFTVSCTIWLEYKNYWIFWETGSVRIKRAFVRSE